MIDHEITTNSHHYRVVLIIDCSGIVRVLFYSVCVFSQVTLSEGPNHIAFFKGSSHQYDLAQEADVSYR